MFSYKRLLYLIKLSLAAFIIISTFTLIFYQFDYTHFDGFTKQEDDDNMFLNRLYFTVTTFSSTGYGDVSPATPSVKILSMILQFILVITIVGGILEF